MSPYQVLFGRQPTLPGWNEQRRTYSSVHQYVEDLQKNLDFAREAARLASGRDKQAFTESYAKKHGCTAWRPYSVGSQVKYVSHYLDPHRRKFSDKYKGPFTILDRRGPNYKIHRAGVRARWVHHDEVFP